MKFRIQVTGDVDTKVGGTYKISNPMIRVKMTGTTHLDDNTIKIYIGLSYYLGEVEYLDGSDSVTPIVKDVPFDLVLDYTNAELDVLNVAVGGTFTNMLNDVVTLLEPFFGVGNVAIIS